MRAGKEVTDHPGVLGLCPEIFTDSHYAGGLLCRCAGKIDCGKAGDVGLGRTGARSHGLILAVVQSWRYLVSSQEVLPDTLLHRNARTRSLLWLYTRCNGCNAPGANVYAFPTARCRGVLGRRCATA